MKRFPTLEGKFLLAPMSGVSDVAFRVLCRRHGAAMTYTEFCSADGLVRDNEGTLKQAHIAGKERPVGIQLFGSSVQTIKEAALRVQGEADVIDFNLGCPAWHVLSQGCGSALLADPEAIEKLVREVSSALSKPFTVKLRLGLDQHRINYVEVARRCVAAGAVAIALHARTTKQGYSGQADWDSIKTLKAAVDVPVIGNGDVFTPEDAVRMLEHTGCDYVMIGRGARNNPFLFEQANELLKTGSYVHRSDDQRTALFQEYLALAREHGIELSRIRSHAISMTKGIPGVRHHRQDLSRADSVDAMLKVVEQLA